jgi:iron complex outermembrane receptor protein
MKFRPSAILLPSFLVSSLITSAAAGTSRDQLYALSLEDLMKVEVESVSMFKEDALKVAASVYSVDMDDANRWNYFDNSDALDMASGVQTYHTFFGGNPIAIRGYAQFLSVRGVSTLIDGVPVNDLIFGSGQYDNEHISLGITDNLEVIKGPGSTLYGSDAFHGTMAFKSYYREVEDFSVDMYFSGDEQRRTKVALSREVMPGQFINLAVDHRLQDNSQWQYYNQVIAANDHRDPELENNSYTIKLHNKESEDLYYKLSVMGNDYSGSGFVGGGASFGYANNDLSASDHNMLLTQGLLPAS